MSRSIRRSVLVVVPACVLALAVGWGWQHRSEDDRAPRAHPAVRRAGLVELRSRLIPSAAGGWVAETPGEEPSLHGWLFAASQQPRPSRAFDQAVRQAEEQLRDRGNDPSLLLVLAQVLPGPTADRSRADRLAAEILEQATAGLARNEPRWLAPMLQLSAGSSPSAAEAGHRLAERAGEVGCDRLPGAGEPLPAPATSLTVAVRVLAASGVHCDRAGEVLRGALTDPAWASWIAAPELTDLVALAPTVSPQTRQDLADRLDGLVAVGPEQAIDLGGVVAVQSARRRVGLPHPLPAALEHHLDGQVTHRGALAGRSSAPPTAFDVAVLRQLVGEHLIPADQLRDTLEARSWSSGSDPADPVIDALLARGERPRCDRAPARARARPGHVPRCGRRPDLERDARPVRRPARCGGHRGSRPSGPRARAAGAAHRHHRAHGLPPGPGVAPERRAVAPPRHRRLRLGLALRVGPDHRRGPRRRLRRPGWSVISDGSRPCRSSIDPTTPDHQELTMDLDGFLEQIDRLAPGYGYDAAARFDHMPVYHRLAITRWLADVFEQPTDLDVIRQMATLGDAHRWLHGALANGEELRSRPPASARGTSTRVRLRPLLDQDLLGIYLASFDPSTSGAWRYRGRTLPAEEFVAGLADGVRAQYVVELIATGTAVGLVSAYDHNPAGLHCKVAFLRVGERVPGDAGANFEGMLLFISHLFATFPYRKVFAEVPAYNLGLFEPGLAQEEGVLREYLFHEGRHVDLHIVSFRRDQWEQVGEATGW